MKPRNLHAEPCVLEISGDSQPIALRLLNLVSPEMPVSSTFHDLNTRTLRVSGQDKPSGGVLPGSLA